jgi:hypothetical protein
MQVVPTLSPFFNVPSAAKNMISTINLPDMTPAIPLAPMARAGAASKDRIKPYDWLIGVCHLSENPFDARSAANLLGIIEDATQYLHGHGARPLRGSPRIAVLEPPAHGRMFEKYPGQFAYYPASGYYGADEAAVLLTIGDRKIRMQYTYIVMRSVPSFEEGPDEFQQFCPEKKRVWRIIVPSKGAR